MCAGRLASSLNDGNLQPLARKSFNTTAASASGKLGQKIHAAAGHVRGSLNSCNHTNAEHRLRRRTQGHGYRSFADAHTLRCSGSCVAHDVDDVADSRSGAGRSFSTSAARLNDAAKRLGSASWSVRAAAASCVVIEQASVLLRILRSMSACRGGPEPPPARAPPGRRETLVDDSSDTVELDAAW